MPQIILLGGPNGAGKTTAAMKLLPEFLGVNEFVNADIIASGLSAFNQPSVSREAGRIMLTHIHDLIAQQKDFAFETTLASRSFIPVLKQAKEQGYSIHILYIWLRDVSLAIERVEKRFKLGGHFVDHDIIVRRYERGKINLLTLYIPIADVWHVFDNSGDSPLLVAEGGNGFTAKIFIENIWKEIIGN